MSGKIKVAVFVEDKFDETVLRYKDTLNFIQSLQDENIDIALVSKVEVLTRMEAKDRFDCDVAVIHMSYQIDGETKYQSWLGVDIIRRLLPVNTRRVIFSKERSGSVSKDMIEKFNGDHYYPLHLINKGSFLKTTLKLGKVSEEERLLRGYSVEIEGTERVKMKAESLAVRGIEEYDFKDDYHKRKEGEI